MTLPRLLWKPSPNFGGRHGTQPNLVVSHDTEGSYESAITTFLDSRNGNRVSAHYVIREDGQECTQMVELADAAWACCQFNGRSINIEMAGWARKGYGSAEWFAMASVVAYLLHHFQIPAKWARGGVGPGFCSHYDLGRAGGGHSDPTTDPDVWKAFCAMVQDEYDKGDFPASWDPDAGPKPCRLNPPTSVSHVPLPNARGGALDLSTCEGVQKALNALGAKIDVDGVDGPATDQAIKSFQIHSGLSADGVAGPLTRAAILKELSGG